MQYALCFAANIAINRLMTFPPISLIGILIGIMLFRITICPLLLQAGNVAEKIEDLVLRGILQDDIL